jgi:hypothetical protein
MKHKLALSLSLFIFPSTSCIENKVLSEEKSTTRFKVYHSNPVIKPGGKGQWDAGALGSMSVLKVGGVFHMYYEAWSVRSEKEYVHSSDQSPLGPFVIKGSGLGLGKTSPWPKYIGNIQNNVSSAQTERK